jgi:hypothetical protein
MGQRGKTFCADSRLFVQQRLYVQGSLKAADALQLAAAFAWCAGQTLALAGRLPAHRAREPLFCGRDVRVLDPGEQGLRALRPVSLGQLLEV